jgi:hypothetical protein
MFLTVQIEDCDNDNGSADIEESPTLSTQLPVRLYQLEFKQHCGILELLDTVETRPRGTTILGMMSRLMQRYGWQRQSPYTGAATHHATTVISPLTQSPKIQYYRLYNVLAIDAAVMEQFLRHVDQSFSMTATMLQYCRQYGVTIEKTFPLMTHDVSNHRQRIGKAKRVIVDKNCDMEVVPRTEEEEECKRLIPVSLLPLLLQHMPLYFTRVNAITSECEALEQRVWNSFPEIIHYPSYVSEQVGASEKNRRYCNFVHQCSYHSGAGMGEYERHLYECEIAELRIENARTLETAMQEITRLRRLQDDTCLQK